MKLKDYIAAADPETRGLGTRNERRPLPLRGTGRHGYRTALSARCKKRQCSQCTALRCECDCHEVEP